MRKSAYVRNKEKQNPAGPSLEPVKILWQNWEGFSFPKVQNRTIQHYTVQALWELVKYEGGIF